MPLLAIETSCDETSAAVVHQGRVLSNVVSSQISLHAEYGGVVPELAAREHLRNLLPVARTALREASLEASQLDAVAATRGPGLPNALLVGFKAAQAASSTVEPSTRWSSSDRTCTSRVWPPLTMRETFGWNLEKSATGGWPLSQGE